MLLMIVTAFLAFIDARQIVPSSTLAAVCSLLSVLGHAPGLIAAFLFRRKRGAAGLAAFLLVFCIGMLGVIAYFAYTIAGKPDNPNSAGHMHVLMFPLAYSVFATVVVVGGSIILSIVSGQSNGRDVDSRSE